MPRFKTYSYAQTKLIPIDFSRQIRLGVMSSATATSRTCRRCTVKLPCLAVCILVYLLFAPDAHPRTWYVKPDSTGDAPTIKAGLDSAVTGDDVLVAPGTYTWTNQGGGYGNYLIYMKSGIWLHSEMGPEATIPDGENHSWSVIFCQDTSQATVEGFTITGGINPGPRRSSHIRQVDICDLAEHNLRIPGWPRGLLLR